MRVVVFAFALIWACACEPIEISDYNGNSDVSVMSFNLRYDEPADGENQWGNRKQACLNMLYELKPTLICIQEGLYNQVTFLDENLQDYKYVGVGRDDGHSGGEYSAIFYLANQFELLENDNFWLSETPEIPSIGWDANNKRIVTWAKLRDRIYDKIIYVFNTHFDHEGTTSQKKSSKLLVEKIAKITEGKSPVFITGDFNMLIGNSRMEPITKRYFSAQRFAEKSDDNKSYNAFGLWIISRNIDFIFYKDVKAKAYKTIVKDYGVPYISDHYPILSHFEY